ncbi:MAG: HEAT repeat domain-containing protein [Acidobacteria bacterium]|nr:HEAT repeat domain-containing protein [Acidobacteriota bacterium]
MEIFEDFKWLLSNFNKIDERIFLGNINDFAEKNKEKAVKIYAGLLKDENINTHLKYLTLKSIGKLKYQEFIPIIRQVLNKGEKIQIIHAAADCLVRINTIEAYKTLALYLRENPASDFKMPVEESLHELFRKNRLLYHFDVFYRDRETENEIKHVEKSSEFLVKNLPDPFQ